MLRALQDNVFDPGFVNIEQFLKQLALGDVDYIKLKWKEEMLDYTVFQLLYR